MTVSVMFSIRLLSVEVKNKRKQKLKIIKEINIKIAEIGIERRIKINSKK